MTVQPTDQISHLVDGSNSPIIIYGAIQYGLPAADMVFCDSYILIATPKSANLTFPCLVINILAPLISRWITPYLCRNSNPTKTCFI